MLLLYSGLCVLYTEDDFGEFDLVKGLSESMMCVYIVVKRCVFSSNELRMYLKAYV